MKLIPIIYHGKNYPFGIKSDIEEIAGHLDKEEITPHKKYSLHTEYSHMKRELNSKLISKYPKLMESHKDNIPQLWKDEEWAKEFANFLIDLIGNNNDPKVIEIHPPFDDYCENFDKFFKIYENFETIIVNKYPNTKILIENRCGTFYKKGNFLLSDSKSIIEFLSILSKKNLKLELVIDYPQIFSAEKIKLDEMKVEPIIEFNKELKKYIKYVGGFHIWGKRKKEDYVKWTPHTGDLNTFFSFDNDLKEKFLKSIYDTFNDDKDRYFVPEVNSGEEDLQSIVADLIKAGFIFPKEEQSDYDFKQILELEWINKEPYITIYDSKTDKTSNIKLIGLKNIVKGKNIRCIGYKDLKIRKKVVCSNHSIVDEKNNQCPMCKSNDVFSYCVACKGIECRNKSQLALDYCNNPHYVYLVYFPGGKIKVGTAFFERKVDRLIEQGALLALYIAKAPNGKIAREIEREVVDMGYVEFVNTTYKANNINVDKDKESIINILKDNYEIIKKQLSSKYNDYLLEDDIFDNYDNRKEIDKLFDIKVQSSLFDDEIIINKISETSPFINNQEILAVVGNIGIVKDNEIKYINLKKLIGWEIESIK